MVEIDGQDVPDTELIRTLGDKYNVEILSVASEPRSAKELNEEFGIPIATGYRRIEDLTELGLLTFEESVLTEERRRRDTYRRQIDNISVQFAENSFTVRVEEHAEVENKLDAMWETIGDTEQRSSSTGL
ncbi:MAG: ArsR family transcriptional regulator [Halobacteriales archaeon]